MDVLTALINKADTQLLLQPLAVRNMGHRKSISADDVVIFATGATIPPIDSWSFRSSLRITHKPEEILGGPDSLHTAADGCH